MLSPTDTTATETDRLRLIHRELLQIAALVVVAAAAFVLTQHLEGASQEFRRRDAAEWYSRGTARLQAGDVDGAVDAFRRATVKGRNEKAYVIALADALGRGGRSHDARNALLALRESAPEDADINLQLARIAAMRDDVTEAQRFYQSTLYAPSTLGSPDVRRQTRLELIRFLLAHHQRARAAAELLASSSDVADTAASHVDLGRLLVQAGEPRRALDQFAAALRTDPRYSEALAGGGAAADRSLTEGLRAVNERLNDCLSHDAGGDRQPLNRMAEDVRAFAAQRALTSRHSADDAIEDGVDLIVRAEQLVALRCAPVTPADKAFLAIGRLHGAGPR